ncbi:hypothetical protein CcaCcLH18_09492 [Colletotrichum camelliae]|nr:hypothetical protein CcaCcLH18_09492 [Colletotrichum camelliae]
MGDIEKFVTAEMSAFSANWNFITPETKELVKETLLEKSDGMFRWTYLQWEQIKEFSTNRDVKRRLGHLPNTLSAAYDEIYNQYDSESFERVMLQRAPPLRSGSSMGPKASVHDFRKGKPQTILWIPGIRSKRTLGFTGSIEYIGITFGQPGTIPPGTISPIATSVFGVVIFGLHRLLSGWWDNNPDVPSLVGDHPRKLLTLAVDYGHADFCEYLIDRAGGIGSTDPRAYPDGGLQYLDSDWRYFPEGLLYLSMYRGSIDVARVLLANGADPNQHVDSSTSLLCWAVGRETAYVKLLLDHGADPNFRCDCPDDPDYDCEFDYAHFSAAAKGYIKTLEILIEGGADFLLDSCLGFAVGAGHLDCARFLVEQVTDIDPSDFNRPLIIAIREGHLDCAYFLIERGADANALDSIYEDSPLVAAVSNGYIDFARFLIEIGADVNIAMDHDRGGSPLAVTISKERLEGARFLIENGANVNLKHKGARGRSPLIAAVSEGYIDIARFLIELGADVNMEANSGSGSSPLAAASSHGELGCARVLIENGADVHATLEFGGYSCVLAAAIFGDNPSLKMIKYLVEEKNADPAQLTSGRPNIIQEGDIFEPGFWGRWKRGYMSKEEKREGSKILVYLVEELKLDTSTLASFGFSIDDMPPDASSIAPSTGNGSGGFSDASSD